MRTNVTWLSLFFFYGTVNTSYGLNQLCFSFFTQLLTFHEKHERSNSTNVFDRLNMRSLEGSIRSDGGLWCCVSAGKKKKSNSSVAFKSRPTKKSSAKRYINVFKICKTKYIVIYLQHALKTKVQIYHIQINMTTEKRRFEHKNRLMSKKTSELLTQNLSFPPYVEGFGFLLFQKLNEEHFLYSFYLTWKVLLRSGSMWRQLQYGGTCRKHVKCACWWLSCVCFFWGGSAVGLSCC